MDGLDSDVWVTADGVAVLDHDGIVRRGLRKIPIAQLPRAELPPHILSLDDLYEQLATTVGASAVELSLDLKDDAALDATLNSARSAGAAAQLWLCHPDATRLAAWRGRAHDIRLVHSTRKARMPDGPERLAAQLSNAGIDVVNLHVSDWTAGTVALFRRFDLVVLAWDAQLQRQVEALVAMGIDGVFADDPDVMTAVLGRNGPGALPTPSRTP